MQETEDKKMFVKSGNRRLAKRTKSFFAVTGSFVILAAGGAIAYNNIGKLSNTLAERLDFDSNDVDKRCSSIEPFYEEDLGAFTISLSIRYDDLLCAKLVNNSGERKSMTVGFNPELPRSDTGEYKKFAGPVSIEANNGTCNTLFYSAEGLGETKKEVCILDSESDGQQGKAVSVASYSGTPITSYYVPETKK